MAHSSDVRSAWLVSVVSVLWTVVTGAAAVAIGVSSGSAVLVAFGAIGFVDAMGSAALVYHFRHGLRHDALADHLEHAAHRVVTVGLFAVGLGAVIVSVARLATGHEGDSPALGAALAAVSLVVLVVLSTRKVAIAARVASPALRADGLLSGVGAAQATVTLVGTLTARWFGWTWMDSVAAIAVGTVAIVVAVTTAPEAR